MTRAAATSICRAASAWAAASRRPESGVARRLALALLVAVGGASPAAIRPGKAPVHAESPAGRWYVIAPGENLAEVARRADVPVDDLLEINGLADAADARPGRLIFVLASPLQSAAPRGRRRRGGAAAARHRVAHAAALAARDGPDHRRLAVRHARGAPPRRHRSARAGRHPGVRGRRRAGGVRGQRHPRLRQPGRRESTPATCSRSMRTTPCCWWRRASRCAPAIASRWSARAAARPVPTCISRCVPAKFPGTRWDFSPS